ncbi:MAG: hypothetical protein H6581_15830 [Bacteroidia bacterium]|nr:hypothetical protein [Bacteroidia bacterium]
MNEEIRDRAYLKHKFSAGSMPSQEDFTVLINSMVNVVDDGLGGSKTGETNGVDVGSGPTGNIFNIFEGGDRGAPKWKVALGEEENELAFSSETAEYPVMKVYGNGDLQINGTASMSGLFIPEIGLINSRETLKSVLLELLESIKRDEEKSEEEPDEKPDPKDLIRPGLPFPPGSQNPWAFPSPDPKNTDPKNPEMNSMDVLKKVLELYDKLKPLLDLKPEELSRIMTSNLQKDQPQISGFAPEKPAPPTFQEPAVPPTPPGFLPGIINPLAGSGPAGEKTELGGLLGNLFPNPFLNPRLPNPIVHVPEPKVEMENPLNPPKEARPEEPAPKEKPVNENASEVLTHFNLFAKIDLPTLKKARESGFLDAGQVAADGKWHNIAEKLTKLQAYSVIAWADDASTNSQSITQAIAVNGGGMRGSGSITTTSSATNRYTAKIQLRWEDDENNFNLQVRTSQALSKGTLINFQWMRLMPKF